jgi:hypothetical protein
MKDDYVSLSNPHHEHTKVWIHWWTAEGGQRVEEVLARSFQKTALVSRRQHPGAIAGPVGLQALDQVLGRVMDMPRVH